ncbi:MAG: hypothetical protein ACREKL_12965, partial [Chthoniobacterales bacterium]
MKKVLLVYAEESVRMGKQTQQLRSELGLHLDLLRPEAALGDDADKWLKEHAPEADFIIILFSTREDSPSPGNASLGRTPVVDKQQREDFPDAPAPFVVVFRGEDIQHIPEDLAGRRCFDISTDNGRDALFCQLLHEQTHLLTSLKKQNTTGLAFMWTALGIVGSLLASMNAIQNSVMGAFGEKASVAVHIVVGIAVFGTLAWGVTQLFRALIPSALSLLQLLSLPGSPVVWKVGLGLAAGAPVLGFGGYYFWNLPNADTMVTQCKDTWFTRLKNSQSPDGGTRPHPDAPITQAWTTAQSLAAMLSAQGDELLMKSFHQQPDKAVTPKDLQRAFEYIELVRISNYKLTETGRRSLAADMAHYARYVDFSRLPAAFPTLPYVVNVITQLNDPSVTTHANEQREPLSADAVQKLIANKNIYFEITDPKPREGWGYFEQFEWGVTEIAAWVAIAYVQSLRATDPSPWTDEVQRTDARERIRWIVDLLKERQIHNYNFLSPMSDNSDATFARNYTTVMA